MSFKRLLYVLPLRLRSLFRRSRVERELADEIRDHIERQTAANIAAGMPAGDARTAALRAFGGIERRKEEIRETRGISSIENALRDIRHAVRSLRKSPGFTGATVLTLALGIGANSAVFTVVNGVLLRPLPYPRAQQLVDLSHTLAIAGFTRVDQSDATYLLYHEDNRVFTDIGIYRAISVNVVAPAGPSSSTAAPLHVSAALVTPGVFRVLGAGSSRGRALGEADVAPGARPVTVISQGLWESAFGSDPAIVGRHVAIDGTDREIVGVIPAGFHFPSEKSELWLPLSLDPGRTNSAAFDFKGIARLRAGVTIAAATANLQRLLPQVPVAYPGRLTVAAIALTKMRAEVRPLRDVMVGNAGQALWIVLGAVGMLLLLACANVANLFLARAEGRQREFAVRRALGANRALLLQVSLAEALVLSAIGGAIGIAVAAAGVGFLHRAHVGASIPRLGEIHVDAVVVTFTIVVSCLVALAVSALPAVRSSNVSLTSLLAANGRAATGTKARHGVRRALVMAQVALGLMLVSGAALFARSFQRLTAVDPGFDAEHAVAFRLSLPAAAYPSSGDVTRTLLAVQRALLAVPGVTIAGVSSRLPLDATAESDSAVFVEDHPRPAGTIPAIYPMVFASPEYFGAMGIPLLAGRLFDAPDPSRDPAKAPREVLVSEAFARRYWTPREAVGKRVRMNPGDPWSTIVGVVGSTHDGGLENPPVAVVYNQIVTSAASGRPWTPRDVAFVLRESGNAADLVAGARQAVRAAAPSLPVYRVITLRALLSDAEARSTFTVLLLSIAAVVALVVGSMGIYGVVAYLVAMRTREIGLRLALGAQPQDVQRMVVRRALGDTAIGVIVGLAGALILTREISALLYSVRPNDPVSLLSAAALLFVTAIGASWLPARRATRIDPTETLRAE